MDKNLALEHSKTMQNGFEVGKYEHMRQAARKIGKRKRNALWRYKISVATSKRWQDAAQRAILNEARRSATEARKKSIGTKRIRPDGYVEIKMDSRGRWEMMHRIIMENRINRLLRPGEVVHHRDFDKLNNAIENLELMSDSNHNRLHRLLEYRSRRQ